MGTSGEKKTRGMDEFASGLVWVRRRNGSWWPGRVLGRDELPESCLTTPRSGTPVKLLGREDASVDWYNLQKSIRIKAFRCGEYDRCIERAKASAAGSFKRGVKYARREHAILHALEIESAGQSKTQADICSNVDKPSYDGVDIKEPPPTLLPNKETDQMIEELISSKDKSMLGHELSHSGVSFEEMNTKKQSYQGKRRKTPNDSEDDETEGIKRMRGLEDLGKRKRSIVANVHEFLKKKSRRRQLKKVLESTAKVTVPVMHEPASSPTESSILEVSDSKVSGIESIESKGSLSVVINNHSDSTGENVTSFNASEHANDALLISCKQKENEISSSGKADGDLSNRLLDVPLVGEDLAGFRSLYIPCATQKPQVAAGGQSSQSSQVETVPSMNEELNESGSTNSGATNIEVIDIEMKEGSSKWMLKGKRNLRNSSRSRKQGFKKPVDENKSNDYMAVLKPGVVGAPLVSTNCAFQIKSEPMTDTQVDEVQGWGTHILHKKPQMMVPKSELATSQRLLPYRQSRYAMNPKYQSSDFTPRVHAPDSNLFDVNVEVKVSCRPRHVPYISLMSKLTGQPIIGHPLTVEALDDGSCDLLISRSKCRDDEDVYGSQGLDTDYEQKPKRRGRKISRKRLLLRRSTGKSPKSRKDGGLSKKIRTLSSITGSHKQNVEVKKPVVQTVKGPSVACVPLKVVFSRINAALN